MALKKKTNFNMDFPGAGGGGVNKGMQIHRSVLFFLPDPSIRRYFCSNPDPHCSKTIRGLNLLHTGRYLYIYLFSFSFTVFRFCRKFSVFSGVSEKEAL